MGSLFPSEWKSKYCNVLRGSVGSGPPHYVFLLLFLLWSHWSLCCSLQLWHFYTCSLCLKCFCSSFTLTFFRPCSNVTLGNPSWSPYLIGTVFSLWSLALPLPFSWLIFFSQAFICSYISFPSRINFVLFLALSVTPNTILDTQQIHKCLLDEKMSAFFSNILSY